MSQYYGFPKYVPVAERKAKAAQKAQKKRAAGVEVQPIQVSGRKIAKSFWGQAWCDHVESFGDYENRLPRGRTYVRNGSIWHLEISKGLVVAHVYGSSSYDVKIEIKTLSSKKWQALKEKCTGKIGSVIELLSGKLSDTVMKDVTDPHHGLLPSSSEIHYNCTCPDWASMCKHVAAVVYGIGARLDENPELLFLLRGVDYEELISSTSMDSLITGQNTTSSSRRRRVKDVENVFGLQLENNTSTKSEPSIGKNKKSTKASKPVFRPTGRNILRLRKVLHLTQKELAETLNVSLSSIKKWEQTTGKLSLHHSSLEKLTHWWETEKHHL